MDSADTVRDPRGFAVKFHTEEGNRDLVGNNSPIFFIRDPIHVRGTVYVCVGGGGGGGGLNTSCTLRPSLIADKC